MAITIDSTSAGTSVSSSSSESGGVISLVPRLTASEGGGGVYINVVAKVSGVNGLQPYFKVPLAGVASAWDWSGSEDKGFFSYDGLTWTQMGTAPDYGTTGYVILRHSSAFTGNDVWFARDRREGTAQIGSWISGLASSYPTLIQNLTGGSSFIVDTYSSQTDERSHTVPATSLYGFWLRKGGGGTNKVLVMISGVHAGEDWATTVYRKCIDFIAAQGTSEAIALLNTFDFLCLPLVNAPGRDGGHYRNSFQVGTGGALDPNRHFSDATPGLEIVTKPRAVINTDFTRVGGFLDLHGSSGTSNVNSYWYGTDGSSRDPLNTPVGTAYSTRMTSLGYSSGNNGAEWDGTTGYTTAYMWTQFTSPLSMTVEYNNSKVKTDTAATEQGQALAYAIYDRVAAGDFGASSTSSSPSRSISSSVSSSPSSSISHSPSTSVSSSPSTSVSSSPSTSVSSSVSSSVSTSVSSSISHSVSSSPSAGGSQSSSVSSSASSSVSPSTSVSSSISHSPSTSVSSSVSGSASTSVSSSVSSSSSSSVSSSVSTSVSSSASTSVSSSVSASVSNSPSSSISNSPSTSVSSSTSSSVSSSPSPIAVTRSKPVFGLKKF